MPDFGDSITPDDMASGRYEGAGQVNPWDPSVANGQISPEAYAEYQRKRKRDAILGVLAILGGTSGASALAAMAGGAGAAAAGGAGSASGIGAGEFALSSSPYLGSAASGVPLAAAGGVGTAAGVGAGVGAAAGAGGAAAGGSGGAGGVAGGAGSALAGMSARDWASLALAGTGVVGGAMQDTPNMAPTTATTDPNLQKLMQSMQGRLDQSEPLYKSIMAMANGLLPTQYQNGGAGGR